MRVKYLSLPLLEDGSLNLVLERAYALQEENKRLRSDIERLRGFAMGALFSGGIYDGEWRCGLMAAECGLVDANNQPTKLLTGEPI